MAQGDPIMSPHLHYKGGNALLEMRASFHNIIFVNIINNCFSFGFMESVKNCFGSKMRMTKQDRYKSNDAEMQKKYMKVM